jgi:hypothetical protein
MLKHTAVATTVLLLACPSGELASDGGSGGSTGRGGASGTGGASDIGGLSGAYRLSLLLSYRDTLLSDGGMGRPFTPGGSPDASLLATAEMDVRFRAQDGGIGLAFNLSDGGQCCGVDGPIFQYANGQLTFPRQQYVLPAGIPVRLSLGMSTSPAMPTSWTLAVGTFDSRVAFDDGGVFAFGIVEADVRENGSTDPGPLNMALTITKQ